MDLLGLSILDCLVWFSDCHFRGSLTLLYYYLLSLIWFPVKVFFLFLKLNLFIFIISTHFYFKNGELHLILYFLCLCCLLGWLWFNFVLFAMLGTLKFFCWDFLIPFPVISILVLLRAEEFCHHPPFFSFFFCLLLLNLKYKCACYFFFEHANFCLFLLGIEFWWVPNLSAAWCYHNRPHDSAIWVFVLLISF